MIKQEDHERVEALYWLLVSLFAHPFEWTGLLFTPKFWQFRKKAARRKVHRAFKEHGFELNQPIAFSFRYAEGQRFDEDAGGSICRKLTDAFVLDGQITLCDASKELQT